MHVALVDCPVAAENLPAAHPVHTLLVVAFAVVEYVPTGHGVHSELPSSSEYVPAGQP